MNSQSSSIGARNASSAPKSRWNVSPASLERRRLVWWRILFERNWRSALRFLLFLALGCLSAPSAPAFVGYFDSQGRPLRWSLVNLHPLVSTNSVNRATRAVRYYIAADAYSLTNTAAEYNAVRASFAQWQSVPGTHLKFEDAGLAPAGIDVNNEDGTNVVYWTKTTTIVNGGFDNIAGTMGVCFFRYWDDNSLNEADVVLNAVQYQWTAVYNASNTMVFIESVLTHELGHFIGLTHAVVGGATMLAYGDIGSSSQAGLSSDEVAGVRALYPAANTLATFAHLRGTVTKNGAPVLGAAVCLEDGNGNLVAGTVTHANGSYLLPCVPAGSYSLRATPLDPPVNYWLVAGFEIDAEYDYADLNFLPSANQAVTLTAGATNTANLSVTAAVPPFHITHIRAPTANPSSYNIASLPIMLQPGQSNMTIGVFSPDFPSSGLTLAVTGTGITHGTVTSHAMNSIFSGLAGVSVVVSVASNAAPGMRSLVVTRTVDGAKACANGFLDLRPGTPDFNFDGLDDRFQRKYFPLFTAPEAGPDADPDGDGFNNQAEYVAGTAPTNRLSLLKLESVSQNASGTTLRWQSVAGKKYQVFSRTQVTGSPWVALGGPVTATGSQAQYFDAGATGPLKFYRVQVLP